jgi:uncharacterized protein
MSDEILEEFIKQFIDSHEVPIVSFTWQGGEPTLLGLDFFEKVVSFQAKYRGNKRIENALQTNGTRLDEAWCRFLKRNDFLVGVSIDGRQNTITTTASSKTASHLLKRSCAESDCSEDFG